MTAPCPSCQRPTGNGGRQCRRCGGHHHDLTSQVRCDYLAAVTDDLNAYAATLDQPPQQWPVADLAAHLGFTRDPARVAEVVRVVLDLGWRPVVGAS